MGNCHVIIAKGIDSLSALHLPGCLPSPPSGSACSVKRHGIPVHAALSEAARYSSHYLKPEPKWSPC